MLIIQTLVIVVAASLTMMAGGVSPALLLRPEACRSGRLQSRFRELGFADKLRWFDRARRPSLLRVLATSSLDPLPPVMENRSVSHRYVGSELELFSAAKNWKRYVARVLGRFISGAVLEVGAGIGSNILYLYNRSVCEWTSLEPDPDLARCIEQARAVGALPPGIRVLTGTIDSIDSAARFDTILYLDVLEHIADDAAELIRARRFLAAEGHLVVLAPAHQFLFSPFDDAIGHHRRYDRASLAALTPPGCRLAACFKLDCAGFFASLANAFLLSATLPSRRQIALWDRMLVPISRTFDRVTGHKFGKTIVAVWRPGT